MPFPKPRTPYREKKLTAKRRRWKKTRKLYLAPLTRKSSELGP